MKTIFVDPSDHDVTVVAYEGVQGIRRDMHLPLPAFSMTVTTVGGFIVVSAERETLEDIREVAAVVLVADLDAVLSSLPAAGATVVRGPMAAPVGRLVHARHADGTVVEYVEHRPQPGE